MAANVATQDPYQKLTAMESQKNNTSKGGWITFPFTIGACFGLGLASNGATANMIVYLMNEYNIKSVDAAQISNIINGCVSLSPIVGAVLADAFFGCYSVVLFSTIASLMAVLVFTLTSALPSLRPPPCSRRSNDCEYPSAGHLAMLYLAVALLTVGMGGTRFTISTMGANQFDKLEHQGVFFNWFFITLYGAMIISSTVFVYIQDSISWTLGFGLTVAANVVALVLLVIGSRYYRRPKAEGTPFTDLARVVVAAFKKRRVVMREQRSLEYYYGVSEGQKTVKLDGPSQSFRFFNRAALITSGDLTPSTTPTSQWRLSTVRNVENLKAVIRIVPLWSSSILVSISIGIQISLAVLQALTMDRHVTRHFIFPASSIIVFNILSVIIALIVFDRLVLPFFHFVTGYTLTPLHRIGIGQFLNIVGYVTMALVERRRENVVHAHHAQDNSLFVVPLTVFWLALPLSMLGVSEALHFPAQVALYYQEFPPELKSTSTGLVASLIALGFYFSTVVVDFVRRLTNWLPDNINGSRLDNVYWLISVVLTVNFGYYLLCAWHYKYQDNNNDEGNGLHDGLVGEQKCL